MTPSQMKSRPIIPRSFLTNLNNFENQGEGGPSVLTPVCISIEDYTLTVEDVIDQTDFSELARPTRRSRRG